MEIETETLFWNVHRKKEGGKEIVRRVDSMYTEYFWFQSDPSERVYPVRPITGTRSIVP